MPRVTPNPIRNLDMKKMVTGMQFTTVQFHFVFVPFD